MMWLSLLLSSLWAANAILTMKSASAHVAITLSNSVARVVVELDGKNAPITAANFVDLGEFRAGHRA